MKKYTIKGKSYNLIELILLIILIPFGFFYVLSPHEIHQKYSLDWILGYNFGHQVHVTIGIIMLGIAFFILNKKYGWLK